MYISKKQIKPQENISIQEIEQIENYIKQIYMWKEITKEALPKFENINQAEEEWIWEVIKKNLESETTNYEQIQEKAKELFGKDFIKEFPKEGTEKLKYNEQTNEYEATREMPDEEIDLFLLNNIKKENDSYRVEIIEYLEDYSPMLEEDAKNYVIIKNTNGEEIGRIGETKEVEDETELVKRNIEKFTKKTIILKKENESFFVEKVFTEK